MARQAAWLLLALAVAACSSVGARDLQQPKPTGDLWAVLIAGSAGWGNYRHQADIAHAYQILRHGGVREERIITMMTDDLADHPENPHPGQLFNRPDGPDVYQGVKIDYSRSDVTATNFLAVLAGNASALDAGKRSSRRVLESGPQDKVFVYYADHGAPGIVGMPSGPFLYADQLHAVIATRARHQGFAEMVIYIEACESGSMFEGLLEDNLNIYATTAANGHESSWGTYCPGMEPAPPSEFGTCLGDLYSVAWMENAEHADLNMETLKKQFQLVKQRVSQNFTYAQGSHVMRFGSLVVGEEPAAEFMGQLNTGDGTLAAAGTAFGGRGANGGSSTGGSSGSVVGREAGAPLLGAVEQRDADLMPLWAAVRRAEERGDVGAREEALGRLSAEVTSRADLDAGVASAVRRLLSTPASLALVHGRYGATAHLGPLLAASEVQQAPLQGLVEAVVSTALPRPAGAALVDDWECLRGMVGAWEAACGPLDQYGMRHTRAFANLCNAGLAPAHLGAAAQHGCSVHGQAALIGPDAHVAEA